MLAAHRNGGRTNFIGFANAWDRFASRDGRRGASRRATERELRVLRVHLEASLLEDDAPLSDLAAARAEHVGLVRERERSEATLVSAPMAGGARRARTGRRASPAAPPRARAGRAARGPGPALGARQSPGMVLEPAGAPLRRLRAVCSSTSRMSPRGSRPASRSRPALSRAADAGLHERRSVAPLAQGLGERGQPFVPLAADLGHPGRGLGEGLGREAITDVASRAFAAEQPGVAERREMLDDGLAGDGEVRGERGSRGRLGAPAR